VIAFRAAGLCIALAALLADDGGFDARSWGWSGAVAAATAALGIAWWRRVPVGRLELLFVGGLAAFGLWALASSWWSRSPPSSIAEAQRAVVPVAVVLVALVVFRRRDVAALSAAVLGAVTLVSAANLLHRATSSTDLTGTAAQPVGYDNALGLLAALGVLLALDAATRRSRWLVALATLPVNALVLVLADSAGASLALGAGLAVAAVAVGGRLRLAGLVACVAALVVGVASAGGHERGRYWPVALAAAQEQPVAGAGAGTFRQIWLEERDAPLDARDAHGLYVETLGELGVVGLVLLLAALAAPLVAAWRGGRRPLLVGAYGAFLAHAGIDWDWELAGVAAAGVTIGSALLLDARTGEREPRAVVAWAAGAAALFLAACVTLVGAVTLDGAAEALREGDPASAEARAERAASLQPWSAEPWLVLAQSRRSLAPGGGGGDARAAALEALRRDANDWRLWLELAQSSTGAERERALLRARSLNPLGPRP